MAKISINPDNQETARELDIRTDKNTARAAYKAEFEAAYDDITVNWAGLPDQAAKVTAIRTMLVVLAKAVRFLMKRELE